MYENSKRIYISSILKKISLEENLIDRHILYNFFYTS